METTEHDRAPEAQEAERTLRRSHHTLRRTLRRRSRNDGAGPLAARTNRSRTCLLSRLVRCVRKLLAQLQVVQNEPVAVVGNAQAVRGLAIGGGGKVGADPGGQPGAHLRALGQQCPVQSPKRGVEPEVAAAIRRQKSCRRPAGRRSALISVELANSFWPRKLSAAPIGVFFQCEALFEAYVEHFVLRLQIVDEQETVGFPRRLLTQPVQLLLRQQGAELLNDGVQLVLVAQPPAAEELR